jgi:hypothetical protein
MPDTALPGLRGRAGWPPGRPREGRPEPWVALPHLAGASLAAALVVPRAESRPAGQVRGARKPSHIDADFRHDHLRSAPLDTGDGAQPLDGVGHRRDQLLDVGRPRSGIAGRPWSPSATACVPPSATFGRTSPAASRSAATGAPVHRGRVDQGPSPGGPASLLMSGNRPDVREDLIPRRSRVASIQIRRISSG